MSCLSAVAGVDLRCDSGIRDGAGPRWWCSVSRLCLSLGPAALPLPARPWSSCRGPPRDLCPAPLYPLPSPPLPSPPALRTSFCVEGIQVENGSPDEGPLHRAVTFSGGLIAFDSRGVNTEGAHLRRGPHCASPEKKK
ncbi:hypothetical protein AAFF_G00345350 [Aldrovandia affinis]|uniref:Uncharacterized protein n=1 Tax=Aldrovandia affinis TaxID=143900 RepID=A0AAD7R694_9TELE|nr:hypothetical protein AAFF_G00345350 [Aldrovandia affinis]